MIVVYTYCSVSVSWRNAVNSKAHGDITRHRRKTINVKGFGNGYYKNCR
jgi:hypothetical protein